MKIPYTIPYQHTQTFSMQHGCISFQFPLIKGKLMHNRSINPFHKNDDFATIYFQGKEDFMSLLFSKK